MCARKKSMSGNGPSGRKLVDPDGGTEQIQGRFNERSRPQAGLLGSSPRFRGSSIRTEKVFNFTALK
jgi:hypothetical protein